MGSARDTRYQGVSEALVCQVATVEGMSGGILDRAGVALAVANDVSLCGSGVNF